MARGARAAVVFLTRVPVGGFPFTAEEWRWSSAHFPLVGALLGLALGAIDRALSPAGELAAAFLTLGIGLLATGAFHEDGLADTADALGGGTSREKVLMILKDSRVGSFGASALVLSIAARAALIARLGPSTLWALPLAMAAARTGPVWQMVALPYATASDASKSRDVTRAGAWQAVVATFWALSVSGTIVARGEITHARASVVFAVASVVTVTTAWRYARRVGGVTGDFLGATEQLAEIAILTVLAWGRA
jgi:adenosylcobinamide-GDP ribazoletransferase